MDADGEGPSLIPGFVEKQEMDDQVVYGVRSRRQENIFLNLQRKFYYRILNSLVYVPIPLDAGDFHLIDRCIINALHGFGESNLYLRGLIAYVSYNQIDIEYDQRKKFKGESKFSWWDYLTLAWHGITSFSSKPLQVATWKGFFLAIISFAGGMVVSAPITPNYRLPSLQYCNRRAGILI